jgi:hypothetical protein
MGLDMYLTKKIDIGAEYEHRNVKGTIDITINGKPVNVNFKKVTIICERAGYWRKANQIHDWFVKNVQDSKDDCGEYSVSHEQMKELLTICKKIKKGCPLKDGVITNGYVYENGIKMPIVGEGKEMTNIELAESLLPVRSGFFFGSTDYDQYYMQDIEDTIEILTECLKDKDADYTYQSSW